MAILVALLVALELLSSRMLLEVVSLDDPIDRIALHFVSNSSIPSVCKSVFIPGILQSPSPDAPIYFINAVQAELSHYILISSKESLDMSGKLSLPESDRYVVACGQDAISISFSIGQKSSALTVPTKGNRSMREIQKGFAMSRCGGSIRVILNMDFVLWKPHYCLHISSTRLFVHSCSKINTDSQGQPHEHAIRTIRGHVNQGRLRMMHLRA